MSTSHTYASIAVVACIYATFIFAIIEIRQFVIIADLSHAFLRNRQPTLQIAYVLTFLFLLYILHPTTILLSNLYDPHEPEYGVKSHIALFTNDVCHILVFVVFFPRACILWLNHELVDNLKNWIWRREVNPQDATLLVKHRKYMKHTHALVYSVYLASVAPFYLAMQILPHLHLTANSVVYHVLGLCVSTACLVGTIKIVSDISVVSDEYSIRAELLASMKSAGLVYVSATVVFDIVVASLENTEAVKWALLLETTCMCMAHLVVLYYVLHWTRNKYILSQKIHHLCELRETGRASMSSFNLYMIMNHDDALKSVKFEKIMNNRDGFQALCHHLREEYGLENALFLLEVTQLKAVIYRLSKGNIADNVPTLCTTTKEESSIFSANAILDVHWLPIDPRMLNEKKSPYELALVLYDKYVDESADLCINISFECRRAIYRYFQHLSQVHHDISTKDKDDAEQASNHEVVYDEHNPLVNVYRVFDDAFVEIWSLIKGDSFRRFTETEAFRRLVSVLFPEAAGTAHKEWIQSLSNTKDGGRRSSKLRASKLFPTVLKLTAVSTQSNQSSAQTHSTQQ
mmetsp:Transcript_74125/g.118080  ORF Transcript_74125/g.118080 Transcript_74125/m.118080 type:complete len:574 (-) Transcript_74125:210-1931(-)|eukprot:CAMPEP_0197056530 /NCGR_PEP_ID=MMETSP1384-20130603/86446_1 /TAXON_ID=29189 /ORGANISM="Ammonia sp." /LENGTH=573 /DNA_ID=CAMNT_0042490573 /DNA_START=18 /DNA_END=1739 /DNA_ORIENTATION=-